MCDSVKLVNFKGTPGIGVFSGVRLGILDSMVNSLVLFPNLDDSVSNLSIFGAVPKYNTVSAHGLQGSTA